MIERVFNLPSLLCPMFFMATIAGPVTAHHSATPFYDADKPVEIFGVVTKFVFRNPHAALFVLVESEDGETTEWQVEMSAPVMLKRLGWTPDILTVGTEIRVSGPSSRAEGSHGVLGRRLTRADGSPVLKGGRSSDPARSR